MKLFQKLFLLTAAVAAFASCDQDYDMPPLSEPTYEYDGELTTIAELRDMGASATQNEAVTITDDLVLRARVIANDVSGNIFKKLYVQDETSGIEIEVDANDMYATYREGQEIYIDLQGLSLSVYGGELQLGYPTGYNYRIPAEIFENIVHKNGWPDESKLEVKEVADFSELTSADAYRLIKFTGVTFEDGGRDTYAPADAYGEHDIVDAQGNHLMVRTSSYADFATTTLPTGTGSVTALLGRFNGTWQLTLRSIDDVQDFDPTQGGDDQPGGGDEPGGGDQPATGTIFSEPFDDGQGDFTIDNVEMYDPCTYIWAADTERRYMKASAHVNNTDIPSESWLISPEIELPAAGTLTLSFRQAANWFDGNAVGDYLSVKVRTADGQWTDLDVSGWPEGTSWTFQTTTADLSDYAGETIQIAFVYTSDDETAGTWEVSNVEINAD